jgi:hypothetical protein
VFEKRKVISRSERNALDQKEREEQARSVPPTLEATLGRYLAALPPDRFSEEQCIEALRSAGFREPAPGSWALTVVNGASPPVAFLLRYGVVRWASRAPRLLERTPPATPLPPCRTVYLPPPNPRPWEEEISALREQLQPSAPVSVGDGPFLRNRSPWPLWCGLLGRELAPFEIVATDEETAEQACATGVFDRPEPEEVARLVSRSNRLAKAAR